MRVLPIEQAVLDLPVRVFSCVRRGKDADVPGGSCGHNFRRYRKLSEGVRSGWDGSALRRGIGAVGQRRRISLPPTQGVRQVVVSLLRCRRA